MDALGLFERRRNGGAWFTGESNYRGEASIVEVVRTLMLMDLAEYLYLICMISSLEILGSFGLFSAMLG